MTNPTKQWQDEADREYPDKENNMSNVIYNVIALAHRNGFLKGCEFEHDRMKEEVRGEIERLNQHVERESFSLDIYIKNYKLLAEDVIPLLSKHIKSLKEDIDKLKGMLSAQLGRDIWHTSIQPNEGEWVVCVGYACDEPFTAKYENGFFVTRRGERIHAIAYWQPITLPTAPKTKI